MLCYSETGSQHKARGKKNEDACFMTEFGDYSAFAICDGAGFSDFAAEAAVCTAQTALSFDLKRFFDKWSDATAKFELLFAIQSSLEKLAVRLNTKLSELCTTLIFAVMNNTNREYIVFHVGDGMVCRMCGNEVQFVSLPENGASRQQTYFVNEKDVLRHTRISHGRLAAGESMIAGTDGFFEGCRSLDEYSERCRLYTEEALSERMDDATFVVAS